MFEPLQPAPADPILGLTDAFQKEPRADKVNLGVGIYKDAAGKTPTLAAVRLAEQRLLVADAPKTYLPITGHAGYGAHVQRLLFGADSPVLAAGRATTAHTPGGTGGLRVLADFVKAVAPGARMWTSDPTWANHQGIFAAAGLELAEYRYYDAATKALDFDAMKADLAKAAPGDLVLLHGCCHNPTGVDPTLEQWTELGALLAERRLMPFFDVAYQGFGTGLEEDVAGFRAVAAQVPELVAASSFSKNFGLYNERVGAATLMARDAAQASIAAGHLAKTIRVNYSNPPRHGAAIVQTILDDAELAASWRAELDGMRDRINSVRRDLVQGLADAGAPGDFQFIALQKGMFSFSGLSPEQVGALKDKYAIYAVKSGRINVGGITSDKLEYVCRAIADVLR